MLADFSATSMIEGKSRRCDVPGLNEICYAALDEAENKSVTTGS